MTTGNDEQSWKQRMYELEEKNKYCKLKRREKNELEALHGKNTEIINQKKLEEEEKKEKKRKKKRKNWRKKKNEKKKRKEGEN